MCWLHGCPYVGSISTRGLSQPQAPLHCPCTACCAAASRRTRHDGTQRHSGVIRSDGRHQTLTILWIHVEKDSGKPATCHLRAHHCAASGSLLSTWHCCPVRRRRDHRQYSSVQCQFNP